MSLMSSLKQFDIFLDAVEQEVLDGGFIDHLVQTAFAVAPDEERELLRNERNRLATEVTNLTTAIAAGGNIPILVKQLAERDQRLKTIDAKLAKPVTFPDRDALRAALERRAGEWRDILRSKHVAGPDGAPAPDRLADPGA